MDATVTRLVELSPKSPQVETYLSYLRDLRNRVQQNELSGKNLKIYLRFKLFLKKERKKDY